MTMVLALLAWLSAPAFAQSNLLDVRPAEVNSDGDATYRLVVYNRLLADGKFVLEALHLRVPGLGLTDDYREVSVGGGVRLMNKGGLQLYGLAHVGVASGEQRFFQPAVLVQFARGRWTASSFVQRYVAITDNAASAWLIDPAEVQYRVAGPVSLGASAYLYQPVGGSVLSKIGPKISVADRYGATEFRVAHVNVGGPTEFQLRRILVF